MGVTTGVGEAVTLGVGVVDAASGVGDSIVMVGRETMTAATAGSLGAVAVACAVGSGGDTDSAIGAAATGG